MLSQAQKVQVGPVVEDGATGGNAYRASQVTHQVEQPGRQLQTLGRETTQGQGDRGRDRELLGAAAQRLRKQKNPPTPIVGDGREVPDAHRETNQTKQQQPTQNKPPNTKNKHRKNQQLEY